MILTIIKMSYLKNAFKAFVIMEQEKQFDFKVQVNLNQH